jgi:hypothetical protein
VKANNLKKGLYFWVPCEVKSGPFPNERRVYVKIGNNEWFGFVDASQLKEGGKQEHDFVRAVILEVQPQGVVLGINGQSPASRPLETSSSEIDRFSPIPA